MKNTLTKFAVVVLFGSSLAACSSTPKRAVEPEVAKPAPLQLISTARGPMVSLDDVLFDFEKTTLRPEANAIIKQAAVYLQENPDRMAIIEGHTDNQGDQAYNNTLSIQRSKAVRETLMKNGISNSRIQTRGFGESRPVASNDTLAGKQANRRVEIIFQKPGTFVSQR